jgi:hypothetical protein
MCDVCGLALEPTIARAAQAYEDTAASAGWWWPHREFVMVCEHPVAIHRDEQGRLHCEDGPAIVWPDGWGVYRVHGIDIPADVILHRETLTIERIKAERNEEKRRVMIGLYGMDRYLSDGGFEVVHEDKDECGDGRRLFRSADMTVVEVRNSTAEPDGSHRVYHLQVDPQLRPLLGGGRLGQPQEPTCRNAVASTFGMLGEELTWGTQS